MVVQLDGSKAQWNPYAPNNQCFPCASAPAAAEIQAMAMVWNIAAECKAMVMAWNIIRLPRISPFYKLASTLSFLFRRIQLRLATSNPRATVDGVPTPGLPTPANH